MCSSDLELLDIIYTNFDDSILQHCKRVGLFKEASPRPRPLRRKLTPAIKFEIFKNCKKLKGIEKFKHISMTKDLTKAQQKELAEDLKLAWRQMKRKRNPKDDSTGVSMKMLSTIMLVPAFVDTILKLCQLSFASGILPKYTKNS